MKNWKSILVLSSQSLLETMQIIDSSSLQFAIVIDEENRLLGTVTDGDIRRGILRGESLESPIIHIMNSDPIIATEQDTKKYCHKLMQSKKLKQLPIVNKQKQVIDVLFKDYQVTPINDNTVILMVGGLGTRLRPLTDTIPKPMLKVGDKPILETIIESFKKCGYTNFILSVNYKKEMIQNYFQDGSAFGVIITYIEENKRMGTAGALSLLPERPTKPIFVMNGDLLTQVHFEQLMEFHLEHKAVATMCVREYEYQIPYGVIETNGANLVSIKEKPVHKSFVNAGIYVLNPEAFDYIPQDEFYDMPTLFEKLMAQENVTAAFPIREYWLDIGRMDDFERANKEYNM
ncbi:alcohol dehydrogenase [Solibacillus sp. R5-41]|uniref:nucleotidyltransferase family protein n=1 Tax=Solibacillus sp. R5-41 TaxID=2048654 RepID=UPI000C12918A|nr:nucleotidyltransferase family protein [Solibacillus sp. R5-41]ATP39079.1 alcohol dehydrogenase [Solibacillus sp. R5-41]